MQHLRGLLVQLLVIHGKGVLENNQRKSERRRDDQGDQQGKFVFDLHMLE